MGGTYQWLERYRPLDCNPSKPDFKQQHDSEECDANRPWTDLNHSSSSSEVDCGQRQYKCNRCNTAFRRKAALDSHKKMQREELSSCYICGDYFLNDTVVYEHIHKLHFTGGHCRCKKCPKYFLRKHYLDEHYERRHNDNSITLTPF